jgi:2-dehydropantoate 2-reductase
MRIAVMATGGVGGYFGARLAAAGEEVHFLARGSHLAALRKDGLTLESSKGDLHLRPLRVSQDPREIGPVDVVIFAVKLWDTEAAGVGCLPLVGPDTAVISFQNGVDSASRLSRSLGPGHVMGGVAYIGSTISAPGVIRHTGTMARLVFGELDGKRSARGEALLAACRKAGIDATLSDDISRELWAKFAMLASFSGVSCVVRAPMGAIREEPLTRELLLGAIAEVVVLAKTEGVELGADYQARQAAAVAALPAEMKPSMLIDLERGNRLELEWLSGTVARLGDAAGIATPIHHFITAALKLHAKGAR